jgi:predicted protein tyrosine phosphatase
MSSCSFTSSDLDKLQHIVDGIYVTNINGANDREALAEHKICSIITCLDVDDHHHINDKDRTIARSMYCFDDSASGADKAKEYGHLDKISQQIKVHVQNKLSVVVHCGAGISRSPTAIIHYLMRHKGMALDEAYTLVFRQRPLIHIPWWFIQLLEPMTLVDAIQREQTLNNSVKI